MPDMTVDDITPRVVQITKEVLCLDGGSPGLESRLVDDLGADSIDQFSLVCALEIEFGGSIEEEDMDGLDTIADIVAFIRDAQSATGVCNVQPARS